MKLYTGFDLHSSNNYLAWAFSEAAEAARRLYPEPRAYYNRKIQKTDFMISHNALSHKLAKAASRNGMLWGLTTSL